MVQKIMGLVAMLVALAVAVAVLLWAQIGFPGIQPWMYPLLVLLMGGIGVAAVRLA